VSIHKLVHHDLVGYGITVIEVGMTNDALVGSNDSIFFTNSVKRLLILFFTEQEFGIVLSGCVGHDIHMDVRSFEFVSHLIDGLHDLTSNFTPGVKRREVSVLRIVVESKGVFLIFVSVL
jgi:hypothetical protein